ncbi:MAG: hypothetical protein MR904_04110 [Clostridia bacterium]|nr:hypothetical protein [Clostridia bacterium]
MKKFTFAVLTILVSFCFILSGCSKAPLTMPQNCNVVYSNGGFVVGVDNYLYFGNAYKAYSDLKEKSDNEGEGVKDKALNLNRVELNNDDKKSLKLDEDEKANYENVISKIAGYDTSNMFVVGENLYFTSPNVHKNASKDKDKYNTYEFNLNTLFKIKLDGSGLKEIYTTEKDGSKFCLTGGEKPTLLIYDNEKIMQVKCYEGATKTETLAEKVKSTVFPYENGVDFVDVYFTADREEDDQLTGDLVKKLNIKTGEITAVNNMAAYKETITLISYNGERLFYTRTGGAENRKGLFSNDFSTGSSEQKQRYDTSSFSATSKIYLIKAEEYSTEDIFVFEYNNKIYIQKVSADNDAASKQITTDKSTIAFVDGTYVYYTTENGIYRVSVLGDNTVTQISDNKDFQSGALDFDGRYVYFYAKAENDTTSTKYLYRADTFTAEAGSIKTECIAELLKADTKQEEKTTEE